MSTFHPYPNKMLSIPQLEPNMHSFVALQHISLFQVGPNGWSRGRFNSPIAKMDKIHHPYMANGKNANVSLALSRVWTTFPFIVQWISHDTTTKKHTHNKFRHNAHLFSHRVQWMLGKLFILNGVRDWCCFDAKPYQLLFVDRHACKCISPTLSPFLIPSKG